MGHCVCRVDLLGCAGKLNEVEDFIKKRLFEPNSLGCWTLFFAMEMWI